ncbi:hypothetical protein Bca4012_023015 [Brassica carinata]
MKTQKSSYVCKTSLTMMAAILLLFILGQASAMGRICLNGVPHACPDKCDGICKGKGFVRGICVSGNLDVVAQCCCDYRHTPSVLSYPVKPPPTILSYHD